MARRATSSAISGTGTSWHHGEQACLCIIIFNQPSKFAWQKQIQKHGLLRNRDDGASWAGKRFPEPSDVPEEILLPGEHGRIKPRSAAQLATHVATPESPHGCLSPWCARRRRRCLAVALLLNLPLLLAYPPSLGLLRLELLLLESSMLLRGRVAAAAAAAARPISCQKKSHKKVGNKCPFRPSLYRYKTVCFNSKIAAYYL